MFSWFGTTVVILRDAAVGVTSHIDVLANILMLGRPSRRRTRLRITLHCTGTKNTNAKFGFICHSLWSLWYALPERYNSRRRSKDSIWALSACWWRLRIDPLLFVLGFMRLLRACETAISQTFCWVATASANRPASAY